MTAAGINTNCGYNLQLIWYYLQGSALGFAWLIGSKLNAIWIVFSGIYSVTITVAQIAIVL
jgi:hypothetical protein